MKTTLPEEHRPVPNPSDVNFQDAIHHLALLIGAKGPVNDEGTEISLSLDQNSAAPDRAKQGYVDVVTHGNEKFVLLSADQVVALAQNTDGWLKRTMADLYPNLPFLPDSKDRPRYSPLADTVDHLRSR